MEDEADHAPLPTAEREAERRRTVLAERHRLRARRRWITGAAVAVTTALVGAGAAVAWNSQGHAEFLVGAIEQWRDDRDLAECQLVQRIQVAVLAEDRAGEVLTDARSISAAAGVYGEQERAAFRDEGIRLLQAMADGALLDDTDRARASGEVDASDVEACTIAAGQARAPLPPPTAENADDLARQWRGLGAADDVDDERVVAFEASVEQLGELATATAGSRAEIAALRADYQAAPADAFDRFAGIDAEIAALTSEERSGAASVLELVAVLADRVEAAEEVDRLALAATAAAEEAAAAAAAAAAEAAAAVERIEPSGPIVPAPNRPRPVQPPPRDEPVQPAPAPPVESVPGQPVPTIPAPPELTDPAEPAPSIPPEPAPEPPSEG